MLKIITNGKALALKLDMEKQKIKELIKLDAERSRADLLGETKEYLRSVKEISEICKRAKHVQCAKSNLCEKGRNDV